MESYELIPLLSEVDPEEKAEGSIDPLGLYLIADRLALRLVPGVRERMDRPRFLTVIAVGQEVTRDFHDRLAADGITPPWLAYEWLIVEALVQEEEGSEAIKSLPGSLKARDALKHRMHLSAKNYLKTPKVFGFHGVYRQIGRAHV